MANGADDAGELKKFTISVCEVNDGKIAVQSKKYTTMINPASYSHKHGIEYDDSGARKDKTTPMGNRAYESKFRGYDSESVDFELVLDGTGVVKGQKGKTVADELKAFKEVTYKYNGSKHEPNVVQLAWGGFIFYGRLTSMSVDHTLFKPSGEPLRAKLNVSFSSYMSVEEEVRLKNNSSPDLSHRIVVKSGDTLPLLCHQVYRQSRYYIEVARYNQLDNFLDLKPGSVLHFPPLV